MMVRKVRQPLTQAVVGNTTKNCCQPPDDSLNLLETSTQSWFFDFAVEKNFWKRSANLLKTELGCQGRNKHGVDFSKEYLYNSLTQHFGGSQAHFGGTQGLPRNFRWENAPIRPSCGLGAGNLLLLCYLRWAIIEPLRVFDREMFGILSSRLDLWLERAVLRKVFRLSFLHIGMMDHLVSQWPHFEEVGKKTIKQEAHLEF